jgi:hypothetical protein
VRNPLLSNIKQSTLHQYVSDGKKQTQQYAGNKGRHAEHAWTASAY